MAKKASAKRAGTTRARRRPAAPADGAPGEDSLDEAVLRAAMELAAEQGWATVSLADIARAAGVRMSVLYDRYPTKQAILDAYARHIDRAVLRSVDQDPPEGTARERLFDLLMRRFDALEPHRDGVKGIIRYGVRDPVALVCGACALRRSMAAMLEAGGISAGGLLGVLRVKGLAAAYLAGARAWLGDDSPDKARTMAALDAALRRLDGWAMLAERLRKPGRQRRAA